jgi:hypothetical protein
MKELSKQSLPTDNAPKGRQIDPHPVCAVFLRESKPCQTGTLKRLRFFIRLRLQRETRAVSLIWDDSGV